MRSLALVVTVCVLATLPAAAQAVAADSSCTVASCGIEMKRVLLIGFRLEQGGEPLPRYGLFGLGPPRIADAVQGSPVALAHAHDYERHLRKMSQLQIGASALFLLGVTDPLGVFSDRVRLGFTLGASGLSAGAMTSAFRARRSVEEAVDFYNEKLP